MADARPRANSLYMNRVHTGSAQPQARDPGKNDRAGSCALHVVPGLKSCLNARVSDHLLCFPKLCVPSCLDLGKLS